MASLMKNLVFASATACLMNLSEARLHGGHSAHDLHAMGAINPALGTHGYPDCYQPGPISTDIEANQFSMKCVQKGPSAALKIGCIGDSITAGAHSSGPTMTYPAQLQSMLDPTKYAVTNLGA